MRTRMRIVALLSLGILVAALPAVVGAQDGAAPAQRNASQTRSSGGACFSPQATKNVEGCPSNVAQARATGDAPRTHLNVSARRPEETKNKATGPGIELTTAQRMAEATQRRIQQRAAELLDREIQLTQRLVRNTRRTAPNRPDILLRLAELYFEKQTQLNVRVRGFDERIFQARQRKNGGAVRQLEQEQRQAEQAVDGVRQEAIRTYAQLVQDHPDFPRMDEVLFSLAFGLEEMRQVDRARQVYYRLIKNHPNSRFVPHAWLSFAEFYFGEGEMENANQFYSKVLEIPPERNPVYGYALYKKAWAAYNLEDFQTALEQFVRTIEYAQQNPDARDAENLARQSRRELVLPYSRVAPASRALDFFRRYTANNEQALETLENLGELYYDTGQWPNTITVYQKLISESPNSDKTCYWQSRVSNAIISSRPKDEQVREVQRLIDLYDQFTGAAGRSAESVNQCKQLSATILVELATAWHREAIGTPEQPGTNDRSTMQLASRLYRLVIDKFPELEQMEFPEIDRRDWPTLYKVSYYYAELLWKMEDWSQCGPAFDRVVELNPQGEYTSDAAYAAVLCYNNLYQQTYSSREREVASQESGGNRGRGRGRGRGRQQAEETPEEPSLAPREFTPVEQGMLNAFQRFVCYVRDDEQLPTVKYRRARIFYEANRFEEAALLFKDVAMNHRDSELAEYAANLYLDSLNVLGTKLEPPRPECILELESAIGPLKQGYCQTETQQEEHADLCRVLNTLEIEVLRKLAESQYGAEQFAECGRTYVRLFRQFPEYDKADEVLYNGANCFSRARLLGRAIQVRRVLIERFPESRLSKRAVFLVGSNYHALAIYGQAADFYEQFARRFPGESFPMQRPDGDECTEEETTSGDCAVASEALMNAVFFRLGLGEEDTAIADARLYEQNYSRRLPRQTAQVVFSLGSIYERQQNWAKVQDHYRDFLRTFGRSALPNQIIQANVAIGRAYWRANDRRRAEEPFRTALQAWTRGAGEAISRLDATDAEKATYLEEAKDAASEAIFYLAEYKFLEVEGIEFPAYRGGRSMERVNAWAQGDFVQWYQRKATAIRAAQIEYERVAELDVPRWEIAAAARIGQMWRGFVDNFRSAPVPQEIANDDELAATYEGALDEASQPFLQEAIGKFEFCLITATRVRWFNEWSQICERELNTLDPARYPPADELRGRPEYVRSTAAEPAPVQLGEGQTTETESGEVEGGGES